MRYANYGEPEYHWGITQIVGKTAVNVFSDDDTLTFVFDDGMLCEFYHSQSCCESVYIEDTNGDLHDLIGTPILVAEERDWEPKNYEPKEYDVEQWTFYTFRTIKGSVDVRWYGTSNGYYSTSVDCRWGEV